MKIAIIDDQKEMIEMIYNKIKELKYEFYKYTSVYDMEQSQTNFDLLLLDIDMPDCNGLEYANQHKDKNIIFVTSLSSYMKESFGSNIYGFIEKTDEDERYHRVIKNAVQEIFDEKYISLKVKEIYQEFRLKDIVYIQSIRPRTISFVYNKSIYTLYGYTLKKLEPQLLNQFIYIDRGTLVNKNKMIQIIGDKLFLKGIPQSFTISVRRKQEVIQCLKQSREYILYE